MNLTLIMDALPLPELYYLPHTQKYYWPDDRGGYTSGNRQSATGFLVSLGFRDFLLDGEVMSEVDSTYVKVHRRHNLNFDGPLAGRVAGYYEEDEARFLVTTSPKFVGPVSGSWPILGKLLDNMFGQEQLPYFLGWVKIALQTYRSGKPRPGQAVAFCGQVASGKTLLASLLTVLFGGKNRVGHPYSYMIGDTDFNSDMFGAETQLIDDKAECRDIRKRRHFASNIKQIAATIEHRLHQKHVDAVMLRPLWRLLILLNDDPERILVLPPIEDDVADKIMLFKIDKHPMPMPTRTESERDLMWNTLISELPAFVDYLQNWQLPPELFSDRYGVTHYHHPDILASLAKTAPEVQLIDIIDEVIFKSGQSYWEGKAKELQRLLTDRESTCATEAAKLLDYPTSCGTYLGRLAKKWPARISQRQVNGHTIWTILPENHDQAETSHGKRETAAEALARVMAKGPRKRSYRS